MSVPGPDQVNPERQLTDRQKQAQQEMTQGVVKTLTFLIYTIRTPIGGSVRPHQVQPHPWGSLLLSNLDHWPHQSHLYPIRQLLDH